MSDIKPGKHVNQVKFSAPTERLCRDEPWKGYFYSEIILSFNVLSDLEISTLNEELGFLPIPSFINEANFRQNIACLSSKI